ncbi:MAG TPA: aminotransferase class V-fold PLP-dependent enzyme, partial [Candidatus Krumholzibacteria bacterium]|nr:aminotransferase class V-fold PLP-dependent enzyme [Candidatus Krumholzibacteria bacterium]
MMIPQRDAQALVREQFPLLGRSVNGRPLVYLDSAATTQKPETVIAAESCYYKHSNANVHRGLHTLGDEATRLYEGCRAATARWLGVATEQVTIQRSATTAINLVARGWEHHLQPGDALLVTEMEHHANFVPWQMLAQRRGLELRVLPITDGGELDLARLDDLLDARVKVVAVTHTSNVLGTVNPVA